MNEDIIKWAREAGFVIDEVAQQHQPNCIFHTHYMVDELLHRFAALVRADEREACAKVCESRYMGDNNREDMEARRCAAAIRERSQE
jgi:hypothetical protein